MIETFSVMTTTFLAHVLKNKFTALSVLSWPVKLLLLLSFTSILLFPVMMIQSDSLSEALTWSLVGGIISSLVPYLIDVIFG